MNVSGITNTINDLDSLYNANPSQAAYFSKLALLELCGWIEQTIDDIIINCSNVSLSEVKNRTHVEDVIVKRTYGFHYEDHFRPMLMKLIGLIHLEKIENRINASGELSILASQLGSLRASRDKLAHTTVTGVTVTYEAPSKMKQYLGVIASTLMKFEAELQSV